jgi:hypothetical protein
MESYKKVTWAAIGATIIVALVAGYFLFFAPKESPLPEEKVPPKTKIQEIAKTDIKPESETIPDFSPLDLELNESDFTLRELVKECSPHPLFAKSLENQDLIRTFVAMINNVADGETPAFHLQFLTPAKRFQVIRKGDKYILDRRSYKRYDSFANALASLDTQQSIHLYKRLIPTFNKALRELGETDTTFEVRFIQAIDVLLATPRVSAPLQLEKKVITYAFSDPKLEQLKPVQKHLLRMGPDNQKKIQQKLTDFKDALE